MDTAEAEMAVINAAGLGTLLLTATAQAITIAMIDMKLVANGIAMWRTSVGTTEAIDGAELQSTSRKQGQAPRTWMAVF